MAGIKKETQRSTTLNIIGGMVNEFHFLDTMPNTFQIRNFGNDTAYVGYQENVSATNYEVEVVSLGTNVYTYPKGLSTIYIFSNSNISLKLNSYEADEFYPTDLDKTQSMTVVNNVASGVYLTAQLPVGDNNIGNVDIASMPSLPAGGNNIGHVTLDTLPMLPAGTNNIGHVTVDTLPALPTGGNNIGHVTVDTLPAAATYAGIPGILNVPLTLANTEYNFTLPIGTKRFTIGNQELDAATVISLYMTSGSINPCWKFTGDLGYADENFYLSAAKTFYVQSTVAARNLQIFYWA